MSESGSHLSFSVRIISLSRSLRKFILQASWIHLESVLSVRYIGLDWASFGCYHSRRKEVFPVYISRKQLKLLKSISKHAVVRTDKRIIEDIEYLRSHGLVVVTQYDKPDDFFYQPRITEEGKAFLYEKRHANRRANIALAISVIALVLSLLTAFTPFADWCKVWISSLLQATAG